MYFSKKNILSKFCVAMFCLCSVCVLPMFWRRALHGAQLGTHPSVPGGAPFPGLNVVTRFGIAFLPPKDRGWPLIYGDGKCQNENYKFGCGWVDCSSARLGTGMVHSAGPRSPHAYNYYFILVQAPLPSDRLPCRSQAALGRCCSRYSSYPHSGPHSQTRARPFARSRASRAACGGSLISSSGFLATRWTHRS